MSHAHATARDSHLMELLAHIARGTGISSVAHHFPKNGGKILPVYALGVCRPILIKQHVNRGSHLYKRCARCARVRYR